MRMEAEVSDATHLVLKKPLGMPAGSRVVLDIFESGDAGENKDWAKLSLSMLERAYGLDEPYYSSAGQALIHKLHFSQPLFQGRGSRPTLRNHPPADHTLLLQFFQLPSPDLPNERLGILVLGGLKALKESVNKGCSTRPACQQKSSHEEECEEDWQKPPLLIFLKKNPEFSKKTCAALGGLFFEIRRSLLVH